MGKRITAAYPIAKAGGIPINTSIPASKETYDRLGGRDVAFVVLHYTGNRGQLQVFRRRRPGSQRTLLRG